MALESRKKKFDPRKAMHEELSEEASLLSESEMNEEQSLLDKEQAASFQDYRRSQETESDLYLSRFPTPW
jgi:hypothetical protein